MLVLTKETTLSTTVADLQIGSQLTKDYTVLLQPVRDVLNKVIDNLDLKMNYRQLREISTIENPADTRILDHVCETNQTGKCQKNRR